MRTQLHTRWSLLCEIAHETEDALADKLNTQMPVIKDLRESLERQQQEMDIAIVESQYCYIVAIYAFSLI